MSTNHTTNYNLCQWEPDDKVLRTDFNADNRAIDAAIKAVDIRVDGKADVSALTKEVNDRTAAVAAVQSALSDLRTTVSQKQDAASAVKLATGTYKGDGQSGKANAKKLDFSSTLGKLPELLIVRQINGNGDGLILLRGMTDSNMNLSGSVGTGYGVTVTWNASAKTVSWYADNYRAQFNVADITYYYFAIA